MRELVPSEKQWHVCWTDLQDDTISSSKWLKIDEETYTLIKQFLKSSSETFVLYLFGEIYSPGSPEELAAISEHQQLLASLARNILRTLQLIRRYRVGPWLAHPHAFHLLESLDELVSSEHFTEARGCADTYISIPKKTDPETFLQFQKIKAKMQYDLHMLVNDLEIIVEMMP